MMNEHQFVDQYSPVHQGYLKHKQKEYDEWRGNEKYSEELFWKDLVQLGWRQHQIEQTIADEINLILQLILECPDCGEGIKKVNTYVIGTSVKVNSLLMAKIDIEKHKSLYCKARA